jgi:multidrug efflux pump subunit AcrA (membrane-fusion protein)
LKTASAQVELARANLNVSMTDIERLTVRSPIDGQVLRLAVHAGEYAVGGPSAAGEEPLVMLGSTSPLHVRVDVDEFDAWRVPPGAAAIGHLRGNAAISIPLTYVRCEPYVIPKQSLTGDSVERTDTRVLQVIFEFDRARTPIFIGQQMDVLINAHRLAGEGHSSR